MIRLEDLLAKQYGLKQDGLLPAITSYIEVWRHTARETRRFRYAESHLEVIVVAALFAQLQRASYKKTVFPPPKPLMVT